MSGGLSSREPGPPDTAWAGFAGMKLQFPRPKDQAALRRKAGTVRGRLLEDSRKKTKQAERMLGNAASVSSSATKKAKEAELLAQDSAKVRDTDVLWENCHVRAGPADPPPGMQSDHSTPAGVRWVPGAEPRMPREVDVIPSHGPS